jgi:glycerol-3-phosphate acyltransferase PlsY
MIHFAIATILAYLIGSIPTAIIIGKVFYKIDIREEGSGNAGATNTIRVLGLKAGIPVLLIDVFKGWVAVFIAHFFHDGRTSFPDVIDLEIILAIAAVIGHVLPLYAGFKGGKGIATLLGIGFALYPLSTFIAVVIFIVVLSISGYVSLGSIIASVTFPIVYIFVLGNTEYLSLIVLAVAVAIFVPITHRKNIKRLMNGEETKFKVKKNK